MRAVSRRNAAPGGRTWYASGLRFECLPHCGRCCTKHGSYAYVDLSDGDLERLAAHLGLAPAEFRRRYTRRMGPDTVLRMRGPRCPLLDGTRCGVYEARPAQCRTFPFWPDFLGTPARWRALRRLCPGVGQGSLVPLEAIREQLARQEGEA